MTTLSSVLSFKKLRHVRLRHVRLRTVRGGWHAIMITLLSIITQLSSADAQDVPAVVPKPLMVQGRVVHEGKQAHLVPGSPDHPIIYVEMGSNNGKWMDSKMNASKEQNQVARCFNFEPQPHLINGPLGEVVRRHNCTLIGQPVWNVVKTMTFNRHANDEASSLLPGGNDYIKDVTKSFEVNSIDIVDWMVANLDPKSYIYGRMDIEGAEYIVLRHMILNGVGCWFDILELEFHALHHGTNYFMRPADVVLPWMLRGCGVNVKVDAWYTPSMIKKDDPCAVCQNVQLGFDMEAAGQKQHEADEQARAAPATRRLLGRLKARVVRLLDYVRR